MLQNGGSMEGFVTTFHSIDLAFTFDIVPLSARAN